MIAYLRKTKDGVKRPAVFLDRDGTLIHDRPGFYLTDPAKLRFYKHTFAALRLLAGLGYRLIIITNQSGVGRGYLTLKRAKSINLKMQKELSLRRVALDGIYFCPHKPDAGCVCRKPGPGLIQEALRHHRVDLKKSFLIGDKFSDMKLAAAQNLCGILLKSGHGRSQLAVRPHPVKSCAVKKDLRSAAVWIKRLTSKRGEIK